MAKRLDAFGSVVLQRVLIRVWLLSDCLRKPCFSWAV